MIRTLFIFTALSAGLFGVWLLREPAPPGTTLCAVGYMPNACWTVGEN